MDYTKSSYKFVAVIPFLFLLSSCGIIAQQQAQERFQNALAETKQAQTSCDHFRYSKPKSYYNYQKCRNDAATTFLLPALNPTMTVSLMQEQAQLLALGRQADLKKMADTDFEVQSQSIKANAASEFQQSAQRQDLVNAQMQSANAQSEAAWAANRPRSTNCTGFGGSVNCTSY